MSRHPGFEYDAAKKVARFDCYVPGSAGKLRRRRTVPAKTRPEALTLWRSFVDELAAEAERKDSVPAVPRVIPTLNAYIDDYFEKIIAGLRKSTQRSHRNIVSKQLLPLLGEVRLDAITSIAVSDFATALRNEGYAPSYINDCVRVLKMLLHQAVERDVLREYPIKKRVRKEKEPVLRLEMTDTERRAFLDAFDDRRAFESHLSSVGRKGRVVESPWFGQPRLFGGSLRPDSGAASRYFERFAYLKPLFIVALETGLRKGDLLKLRWSSIDFAEGWIRVVMEKTDFEATIPISAECERALDVCRKRPVVSSFVFVDEDGQRLSETRVKRSYSLAKKLAGISRRCRFHDLRHTFASRLVSRGVNLKVVATALGHTTTEQTERYARPSEVAMREIKTALDRDAVSL
jgi:integrase